MNPLRKFVMGLGMLVIIGTIMGQRSPPPKPPGDPPPTAPEVKAARVVKEFPRYQRPGGPVVRGIVIAPNPSLEELIALAKRLYRENPDSLVVIFTDGDEKKFRQFMQWDLHETKPDAARYPKPEKWLERHELAIVHRTNLGRPGGWREKGMLQIFNHKGVKPSVRWGTTVDLE
jgi:hypothetical protein